MPSVLSTAPQFEIGFQLPPHAAVSDKVQPWSTPSFPLPIQEPENFNPVMLLLIGYLQKLQPRALDVAVAAAVRKLPCFMEKINVRDGRSFLIFANNLLKWIPHENYEARDIYEILCGFYFVMNQSPLKDLQTSIHPDQVGLPLSWLSSWIVVYAQLIGLFMDSTASLTEESLQTFIDSPPYRVEEAVVPPGGWRTFNEFFARQLKEGKRPIASPNDDKVIVYPADCTYDNSLEDHSIVSIAAGGIVDIKGLPWTIGSLLQGSDYAHDFEGGIWMHAFLNTYNYHRQHAPVSGRVIEARNIQGAAYLEVTSEAKPSRFMNGLEAPDNPGYQFLQSRGCIIIENPVLGKVAMLPIGMCQVSSVRLIVKPGDEVKKGQEIAYFQFGGSDVICVFQAKAGLTAQDFVPSPPGTHSEVNSVLAVAP